MQPATVFDQWNTLIADFVNAPENRRLRPGTGGYSTLFRGSLFGMDHSVDVASQLEARRVRVLWLGMNPNMPSSLAQILAPSGGDGDYPTFGLQRASGYFASWKWRDGIPDRDWNPIERPRGGWRFYRDLLERTVKLDEVAMANFLPWGSGDVKAFLAGVSTLDRGLLDRAIAFADDLNTAVVEALAPDLLVVPFSLGRNRALDRVRTMAVTVAAARDVRAIEVAETAPRFTFYVGQCTRGRLDLRTLYLRHPAALQYSTDARRRIAMALGEVLAKELS